MLPLLRPLSSLIPSISRPAAPLSISQKTVYTSIALFIYLICSQIPLYGIQRSYDADPLYWARIILASSKGTLMEFGISPIISAGWIVQIMASMGLLRITSKKDAEVVQGVEKVVALIFCFGEAAGSIWYGSYGVASNMSYITIFLLMAQLMMAGLVVILLDDLLRGGYGLGSGISLFIVANISQTMFWSLFSPVTMTSEFGVEFQGSFICLIHFLLTKPTIIGAISMAFTRQTSNNLSQFTGAVCIFFILIYLQRFKVILKFIHQKYPGYVRQVPIKLFFTSNMSVILQSMVISHFYQISSLLYVRFTDSQVMKLIGTWENGQITGGLLWWISPPGKGMQAIQYPLRSVTYVAFVCFLCAMFAKFWIVISKSTPKDYARQMMKESVTTRNPMEQSNISLLTRYINIAAMLGGVVIGLLTILGDLFNVTGSSTGIMLSISILYGYYEKLAGNKATDEDDD